MRVSRALPDWNVVVMPPINYGHAGANLLGDMSTHPGTYGIRQSTLRSLVADVGGQTAQNGFKWVFVLIGHGAPTHNIAINEACDFVSETFQVTMLHLTGLFRGDAAIQSSGEKINARYFRADERVSFGMDVHAGVSETSEMLAVHPDLVRPAFKSLPSQAGRSLEELRAIAMRPGWQGYLSSPARATAAHGRAIKEWWIEGFTDLMLRAVRGENMFVRARVPEWCLPLSRPSSRRNWRTKRLSERRSRIGWRDAGRHVRSEFFTARALATVLAEIGAEFERATGHKLIVISDLPNGFLRRVDGGEHVDLFISVAAPVDDWIRDGRLVATTRTEIARSGIGVQVRAGSPKPDIRTVDAFKRALLDAKSIAYLKVGSGLYMDGLLARLGISDAIKPKVTRPDTDIVSGSWSTRRGRLNSG